MTLAERVMKEVAKVFVGKNDIIRKVMLALLAQGHVLLEDRPGVGKTTLALAMSKAIRAEYRRIQFTPDVMPSDITGFSMYDKERGEWNYERGAILCNLFLADEINRASSRTQAALLEAMEEGRVTVDGIAHEIPKPFMVIATQNPAGSAGTQLLPESQMDRFMVCLSIGYPSPADEVDMLQRKRGRNPMDSVEAVASGEDVLAMRLDVETIYVHQEIDEYIVRLVSATRDNSFIRLGASPRASVAVARLAQASAFLRGRDYVLPDDVLEVFRCCRLPLSPKAKAEHCSPEDVIRP
ncbi:MAG: AAA family ATPase [Bianqueaceae bacterium]